MIYEEYFGIICHILQIKLEQLLLKVYRKIDQRGRELERLLDQYDMHLASPPLYKLKYIPENYTFIDVTLGGENIQFHDWKFWEDSLSDHPYIFFQVCTYGCVSFQLLLFSFSVRFFQVKQTITFRLTCALMFAGGMKSHCGD